MTSEIRANTLKNRVGLGTVSFTNTGPVVSGIVTANGLELNSVDAGSSAGPEFKLFRNSASPADADYLGQLKFAGESDTGVERNYAKITGKILDASNGTEDGILEFTHIKAGSQTITGRWRSDSLQLLNSTNFSVAGTSSFTGAITANGGLTVPDGDVNNNYISAGDSQDIKIYHDGSHSYIRDIGTGGLRITTNSFNVLNSVNNESMITATEDGAVKLYYNHNLRLETEGTRTLIRGSGGLGIYGDSGSDQNGHLTLHPTGSAVYTNIYFYNAAGNSYASIIGHAGGTLFFTGGTNSPLRHRVNGTGFHSFQEGNTQRVTITAGGTVNIGGDFTNTTGKLKVTGNSIFTGDIDVDGHTNLDNVSVAGVTTFTGNANFGSNGYISGAANFALTSNKLRVTGSDTVGIECQRAGNATIQCTDTSNSTDLQLRANSSGGLVRTASNTALNLGTFQKNRIQITNDGKVQIGLPGSSTSLPGAVEVVNIRAMTDGNLCVRAIGSISGAPSGSGVGIDVLNDANNAVKDLALRGATVIFKRASAETLRIDTSGRALFSGTLGYGNMPFGGNPSNAAIQIRCNSKYNGIAFGENAVSGAIGLGGVDTSTAMVFTANAHPANLGGGVKDIFEWWSGNSGGGGPGKYMTLDTGGHLALTTGNLEFANGNGIDFSAVPDGSRTISTDGNKLDDYEEGSFTISAAPSSSGSLTLNSSYNTGVYTKVGKLVHIQAYLSFSVNNNAVGYLELTSLPFTVDSNQAQASGHVRAVQIVYLNGQYAYLPDGAGYYNAQLYCNEGNTWIRLYDLNDKGRRIDTIAKFLGGGADVFLNFSYLAA